MKITLIAAKAKNNVIGSGKEIPWQAKGEQLLFKAMTIGSWCIVGRKTFVDMGVLPDRKLAVISSKPIEHNHPNVYWFKDTKAAEAFLEGISVKEVFIIGGGTLYKQYINRADELHLTTVDCEPDGDVYFPPLNRDWTHIYSREFETNIKYTYDLYVK